LFCLELRYVYSYYHLVSLICCYCYVGYQSDSVDYSSSPLLECFTDVSVFPYILSANREAFVFTRRRGIRV
jgi:hypothetical protein